MLFTALLVGIVVGAALAVPPGPIAVSVMKQALEGRYKEGMQISIGASAMDIVYALAAAFASSGIMSVLKDKVTGSQLTMLVFQAACVVVLIVLGLRYMRPTPASVVESAERERVQEEKAKKLGLSSPLLVGVLISVTNLASPTFLPTLIFLIGYLHASGWVAEGPWASLLYSLGFGVGSALWFILLLRILFKLRTRIPGNFITVIFRFAGGTFLLFAAILLYHIVMETKWSEII